MPEIEISCGMNEIIHMKTEILLDFESILSTKIKNRSKTRVSHTHYVLHRSMFFFFHFISFQVSTNLCCRSKSFVTFRSRHVKEFVDSVCSWRESGKEKKKKHIEATFVVWIWFQFGVLKIEHFYLFQREKKLYWTCSRSRVCVYSMIWMIFIIRYSLNIFSTDFDCKNIANEMTTIEW